MSEEKEGSNPLIGIYGLGVIGVTALFYKDDGLLIAFGKSLLWPFYVAMFLYDVFK